MDFLTKFLNLPTTIHTSVTINVDGLEALTPFLRRFLTYFAIFGFSAFCIVKYRSKRLLAVKKG